MNITEAQRGGNWRAGRLAGAALLLLGAWALAGCSSVAQMLQAYEAGDASQYDRIVDIATRSDYPYATRKQAVKALGQIGDRRAVPALVGILTEFDRRTTLKEEALVALGQIGDPETATPIGYLLDRSLSEPNAELRLAAMTVLGQLGGDKSAEILVNALAYYDAVTLRSERGTMRGMFSGEEATVRALRDSVRTPRGEMPMVGLYPGDSGSSTGFFGPEMDYVPEKLEESTPKERIMAHEALVRIGPAALPAIRRHLSSREVTYTLREELGGIVSEIEAQGS
ncbi:MAG: HEAT repeat domain-containing protein [Gemmatimonadota bacterium]